MGTFVPMLSISGTIFPPYSMCEVASSDLNKAFNLSPALAILLNTYIRTDDRAGLASFHFKSQLELFSCFFTYPTRQSSCTFPWLLCKRLVAICCAGFSWTSATEIRATELCYALSWDSCVKLPACYDQRARLTRLLLCFLDRVGNGYQNHTYGAQCGFEW
jgi:hypothetical protein